MRIDLPDITGPDWTMSFTRKFWFWVVVALAILNVAGGIFASLTSEPVHAFLHGAAAVGFGLWARYLRAPRATPALPEPQKVELLQDDSDLQRRLDDAQALLDFDKQLLRSRDE
jgi:hypothetical protein